MDHREVFDGLYAAGGWRVGEGVASGPGSDQASLGHYFALLERVMALHRPQRVLDLGCGFFAPYADVPWPGSYVGLDAAELPIAENKARFEVQGGSFRFEVVDWLHAAELPPADLVICKDVLQHWTMVEIERGLQRLSTYPLVLVTNSVIAGAAAVNAPVETGGFAPLNLLLHPWNRPRPELFATWVAKDNPVFDVKLALLFEGRALQADA